MISSAIVLVLAAAATWSQPVEIAIEPPMRVGVKGVAAERTLAEFMNVCVRPRWDAAAITKAAQESDLKFTVEPDNNGSASVMWTSPRGILSVTIDAAFSQCALSIGSIQPRNGEQLLSMLRPALEAELGHSVETHEQEYYLEWSDKDSGYVERITLEGATSEPNRAIWYLFDRSAPGVREELEALVRSSKSRIQ